MKFQLFLGTVRDSSPPRPKRLGERVARATVETFGALWPEHELEVVDALDFESGGVFKPHFAFRRSNAPADLNSLADAIESADGYVMVSPEYNHSLSPALAHLLNHFGSSLFSYKPSAIVTYSAGQWGGTRAAVALRTFLSELGCLPVSAMIHVPKAAEAIDDVGRFTEDPERWQGYFGRTLAQLIWWAEATARQRERLDPRQAIGSFQRDPSQRNAPGG
jgi:NAD(P)H-dependent FMN reductase